MSKKNEPEEEYFHRLEQERLQKLRDEAAAAQLTADADAARELHRDFCGKCGTKMKVEVFKGVEIDVCPNCGAVLLDPGELETLVGRDESGVVKTLADFFKFTKQK